MFRVVLRLAVTLAWSRPRPSGRAPSLGRAGGAVFLLQALQLCEEQFPVACAVRGKREASRFASREPGTQPSRPLDCVSFFCAAMPYYYGSYASASPYYSAAYAASPYYSSYASPYSYGAYSSAYSYPYSSAAYYGAHASSYYPYSSAASYGAYPYSSAYYGARAYSPYYY